VSEYERMKTEVGPRKVDQLLVKGVGKNIRSEAQRLPKTVKIRGKGL